MSIEAMKQALEPCPFCGAGTTEIRENGKMWSGRGWSEQSSVSVFHWCEEIKGQPSRAIERVGKDLNSAVKAWNLRQAIEQAEKQQALDKKADNARELGLDYEPVPWIESMTIDSTNELSKPTKPVQEPVSYPEGYVVGPCICGSWPGGKCLKCPRIASQPQHEWAGLTDEEVNELWSWVFYSHNEAPQTPYSFARAIEKALKEKNT